MNMPLDRSKELLPYQGRPLIEHTLDKCKMSGLNPLVLIRSGKRDLVSYCRVNKIMHQVVEVREEWNETVLQSQLQWETNNILMLPDTVFTPVDALKHVKLNLELGNKLCVGIHMVNDVSQWGQVSSGMITEKPLYKTPGYAWGVIGFHKSIGEALFHNMKKGSSFSYPMSYILLDEFKDVTRNPEDLK